MTEVDMEAPEKKQKTFAEAFATAVAATCDREITADLERIARLAERMSGSRRKP